MRWKSIALGCGAAMLGFATAVAAPATPTPEQAAAIKEALQRYVGQGSAGSSPVTVTPDTDHYLIAIDLKVALHALEGLGFELQPVTYSFTAADTGTGLWRISHVNAPKLTIKHDAQSYSMVLNGPDFDGLFDPSIPGFQSSRFTYDSLSVAAVGTQNEVQTRQIDQGRQVSMATATGEGTSDIQISQTSDGFSQDIAADAAGQSAGPSGPFALKAASTSGGVAAENLHTRALADLWAFFVAHPDEAAVKAAQDDLRVILRRALPVFDRWIQSGESRGLRVDSPYGSFAAESFGGRMKLSGLVADAAFESEVHVAGLSIPSGLVPAWAAGMVPTAASLEGRLSGAHLDSAARQAVDTFDLNAKEPWTPAVLDSMKAAVGPLDQMTVTLAPSHLAARLMTVDFDGVVHLGAAVPSFDINVTASGLDAALQELESKGAGDPSASQVAAVLVLAKGLGKAEADGRLRWAVVRNAAGQTTVNGLTLPGTSPN